MLQALAVAESQLTSRFAEKINDVLDQWAKERSLRQPLDASFPCWDAGSWGDQFKTWMKQQKILGRIEIHVVEAVGL